jgi:hypothetical protein
MDRLHADLRRWRVTPFLRNGRRAHKLLYDKRYRLISSGGLSDFVRWSAVSLGAPIPTSIVSTFGEAKSQVVVEGAS